MRRIVHRQDGFFITIFHCQDENGRFTIYKPHYGEIITALAIIVLTVGVITWLLSK